MTSKRAERIMAMEVRCLEPGPRRFVYAAYNGNRDVPVVKASGTTAAEALGRLVEDNYDRVGQIVFTEQEWRCLYCGRLQALQRHHLTPRSKGRLDDRSNLVGSCAACHSNITNGEALGPHPAMVVRMEKVGLKYTPTGWIPL